LSVVRGLETIRRILLDVAKRPDCAEITYYSGDTIEHFVTWHLDRAIKRYKSEAHRVRKYYP